MGRILPPDGLKDSILAGMHTTFEQSDTSAESTTEGKEPSNHPMEPVAASVGNRSNILRFRPWMGIAAVFLFASVLLIVSRRQPTTELADERSTGGELIVESSTPVAGIPDVIRFLASEIANFNSSKFDKQSEQINELQSYLAHSGMPQPAYIPEKLEAAPTIGCVTFDYDGTKMSMICFRNGQVYHLITVSKNELSGNSNLLASSSKAEVFEHEKQAFKVWSKGDHIYILCTEGTKEDIPEFI